MPLPRRIILDGLPWSVHCTARPPSWVKRDRGETLLGYLDAEGRRVWISKSGTVEDRASTLAHELMHAVDPCACEHVVLEAERRFYSLLRDNDLAWARERTT